MTNQSAPNLPAFAAQVRDFIQRHSFKGCHALVPEDDREFDSLARSLFKLQFDHNPSYRQFCQSRKATPQWVKNWRDIPALLAAAFKELELSSIPPEERTAVFHSSGTTEHRPGRHFHNADSMSVYEASLVSWFAAHFLTGASHKMDFLCLTPPSSEAPNSSLVHMLETIAREFGAADSGQLPKIIGKLSPSSRLPMKGTLTSPQPSPLPNTGSGEGDESAVHGVKGQNSFRTILTPALSPLRGEGEDSRMGAMASIEFAGFRGGLAATFTGKVTGDGAWTLDLDKTLSVLRDSIAAQRPIMLSGTAFSFVHLLDHLDDTGTRLQMPRGSCILETGGYKGRSRALPKAELHSLISGLLGIPAGQIVCEYGMSELGSQAYDAIAGDAPTARRGFRFPPWARTQIISPETGREVAEGETGLIRVFDLANVYSVMAIQTEDLGIRRGSGFELLGRAAFAEPRGCSFASI